MKEREALKLAANINPFGSVENARARDAAIEALAQPEQEPVAKFDARQDAERLKSVGRGMSYNDVDEAVWKHTLMEIAMRLETGGYTTPPQRTWVGLTERERMMCRSYDIDEAILNTEAKLKEKNCDR